MKVHILFTFTDGPLGGGNQFLKSLKGWFENRGIYEADALKADVVLFNSHHDLGRVLSIKKRDPGKLFVHRVDGPISRFRETSPIIDETIYWMNRHVSDGTIFQSLWSRDRNREMGLLVNRFESVIMNAPDPDVFNPDNRRNGFHKNRKLRLINTSWSDHNNKGFDVYRWLDDHLDFSRHEMTFIGRSRVRFRNIRQMEPIPNTELADHLKGHDVFIIASRNDACSNSLIEALHCGIPAVALRAGGHPEIVSTGGRLFDRSEEIPELLEDIRNNYREYQESIRVPTLDQVASAYASFIRRIHQAREEGIYQAKSLPKETWARGRLGLVKWAFSKKLERLGTLLSRGRRGRGTRIET